MLSETMVSGVYYPRRPEVKKELTYTATTLFPGLPDVNGSPSPVL